MIEHGTVLLNDLEFTYLASGQEDGEPVILLHGFPQFADVWSSLLDDLGIYGFRSVAPDQRGYSCRARPTDVGAYAVSELASDVLALGKLCTGSRSGEFGRSGAFLAGFCADFCVIVC